MLKSQLYRLGITLRFMQKARLNTLMTTILWFVDELISQYEPSILNDTSLLPGDYQAKLLRGIIGIKIKLDSIQAKEKLGQHKSIADQLGVVAGLKKDKHPDAQSLLSYMLKTELV